MTWSGSIFFFVGLRKYTNLGTMLENIQFLETSTPAYDMAYI